MRAGAAPPPGTVQRERVDDRPGAGLQVVVVKAAQHRLAVSPHRGRITAAAPPGHLQPPAEVPGIELVSADPRPIPAAQMNRNQRSRSIPYDRTVASDRPAASRSRKNAVTGSTVAPSGPVSRNGSYRSPVAISSPAAGTTSEARSLPSPMAGDSTASPA